MKKKFSKYLAGLLSVAVLSANISVPAFAAEAEFGTSEGTEAFTEAQESGADELFSQGTDSELFSQEPDVEENQGDLEGQILLSGLPVLTEALPGDTVIPVPDAKYLALGDSISTGYGLADKNGSFVNILAKNMGLTVNNVAVDGAVSQAVLAGVASGQFDALFENAEVITLTIGGNDMMAALYQLVADTYNAAGGEAITAMDVPTILSNAADPRNAALTQGVMKILMAGYDSVKPQFAPVLNGVGENLKNMAAYIKSKNPGVQILVANQYNPYKWLTAPYNTIGVFFNGGVMDLNAQIGAAENGAGTTYTVVDAYTAFAASEENLCNATALPMNLDFHPNSKGHEMLAALFTAAMPQKGLDAPQIKEVTAPKNRVQAVLADKVDGAEGYDFVIGKKADCIKTGEFVQTCMDQKDLQGDFFYMPKGTYYVYSRAWKTSNDGTKVYSDWSQVSQVKVTATTPAQPKIQSVKVKGNTVTVTFTKAKNATGYDLVLGTSVKKVNGESRPVAYGKYVIKSKSSTRVTVTFKNVKKGTYYAGLHAYNRTAANKGKVFSKWSPARKVIVK